MPKTHVVANGECLSSIAHRYGFLNWKLIYDSPDNASLRSKRPNPNVLYPGDVLVIPDKREKERVVATSAVHRHVVTRPKWVFRLVLRDQRGDPLESIDYELSIDGAKPIAGTTGADGVIECLVPAHARRGELLMLGEVHVVAFGAVDPVTRTSGVQARLANLGFDPGPIDGVYGHRTAHAVYGFQISQGMDATGDADDATRARLLREHDGDARCLPHEEPMTVPYEEPTPPPSAAGVALAPIAEENQREIIIVGGDKPFEDQEAQPRDDRSMNFFKAAMALTPNASNAGEAVLYVRRDGYSAEGRREIEANHGWATSVQYFGSVAELVELLREWPSHSVVRVTLVAHGFPDCVALNKGALSVPSDAKIDASFFAKIGNILDPHAVVVSHACRTGDASLAQAIADAAHVPVYAWTGRTSYAHKNDDKTLTEIYPSAAPRTLAEVIKTRSLSAAVDAAKEWNARHHDMSNEPKFVRFDPGAP